LTEREERKEMKEVKRNERGFYCCTENDKDIEGHSLIIVNAKGVIV